MNLVVSLSGSLVEYSFMMLVNNCFVNTVLIDRRGSSDGVIIIFSSVAGR